MPPSRGGGRSARSGKSAVDGLGLLEDRSSANEIPARLDSLALDEIDGPPEKPLQRLLQIGEDRMIVAGGRLEGDEEIGVAFDWDRNRRLGRLCEGLRQRLHATVQGLFPQRLTDRRGNIGRCRPQARVAWRAAASAQRRHALHQVGVGGPALAQTDKSMRTLKVAPPGSPGAILAAKALMLNDKSRQFAKDNS